MILANRLTGRKNGNMETQVEFLLHLLSAIFNESTHEYYDRVTKLADDYYAYITGDGLNDKMQQFAKRETDDEFDQRKRLTRHIIPSVVSRLVSPERKVPRSNGKLQTISYADDKNEKQLKELNDILSKFWGDKSLDNWMETRWLELNDIDPNTFMVFEWLDYDNTRERAQPYPYEVSSHNAILYEYHNNILHYLVDRQGDKESYIFTLYAPNFTIRATKVPDENMDTLKMRTIADMEDLTLELAEGIDHESYVIIKDDVYFIELFEPHNLEMVPAFCVGYNRDGQTGGNTYVSPYHAAVPYLEKTIKANSELDITMALHAFPQKIQAVRPCINPNCHGGKVQAEDGSQTDCTRCRGVGFEVHSSAQDSITVKMPEDKDEQLSLDNIVHYVSPDTALLDFQDQFINALTYRCQEAMYNSEIFTKEQVSETATEKTIDLDNIYDTLFPLSVKYAKDWKFSVRMIAKITELDNNLIAIMTFSKDFKFKSKDDIIAERNAAKEAGSPDSVLRNIDDDIMRIDTADDPYSFKRYKTKQEFDPFSGKQENEKIAIKTTGMVPKNIIVLDDNYGWIFDAVEMEDPDFYDKNKSEQWKILMKKVDEIIKQTDSEAPEKPELDNNGLDQRAK